MPRNTYLYENKMFTNNVCHSIMKMGKEKASRTKTKELAEMKE